MSEIFQRTCKYLNYVENLLILASTLTGCVSISAFASLVRAVGSFLMGREGGGGGGVKILATMVG